MRKVLLFSFTLALLFSISLSTLAVEYTANYSVLPTSTQVKYLYSYYVNLPQYQVNDSYVIWCYRSSSSYNNTTIYYLAFGELDKNKASVISFQSSSDGYKFNLVDDSSFNLNINNDITVVGNSRGSLAPDFFYNSKVVKSNQNNYLLILIAVALLFLIFRRRHSEASAQRGMKL